MSERYKTDVVILGAGPVGLFAVFQCGMLGMRAHVVDALDAVGGQCTALYPEKPIYDIPSQPEIPAGVLISRLEAQAAPFAPVYHLGQQAVSLAREGELWVVRTSKGVEILCTGVVIAAGGGAFGPNRPPIEGIEAYEGRSVFYMVQRRSDFSGNKIVIAGGGDSAVDWAVSLSSVASHIFVVHRRDTFRAAPETVAKLYKCVEDGQITLVTPFQLKGIEGEAGRVTKVHVVSLEGQEQALDADKLLCFFGLHASLGPIETWGVNFENGLIQVNPATCETSLPGVYAIGDCAVYPGKLKLILTGFAEAAQAAHTLWHRTNPGQSMHMEYSTSKGIPVASVPCSGV